MDTHLRCPFHGCVCNASTYPKNASHESTPYDACFPDARVESEKDGPLGMLHVVGSSLIREAPGLSLNFGLRQKRLKPLSRNKSSFSWMGMPLVR